MDSTWQQAWVRRATNRSISVFGTVWLLHGPLMATRGRSDHDTFGIRAKAYPLKPPRVKCVQLAVEPSSGAKSIGCSAPGATARGFSGCGGILWVDFAGMTDMRQGNGRIDHSDV